MVEQPDGNSGIYDAFPGYRRPSEEELAEALRSALVVVDANVLLNLYRYNEATRDDLLGLLRGVGDRLWVPHQVMREFWRNRLTVLAGRAAATDQVLTALGKQQRAADDALHQWAKTTALADAVRDDLVRKVDALHRELVAAIRSHTPPSPDSPGLPGREPVLDQLEALLRGKVGAQPDHSQWKALVQEGKRRAGAKEPPGYLDAGKDDSSLPEGAAGDYLVWAQAVQEAARRDADLLLVTGDEKEDWWWRYRSDFLGPRVELVEEFAAASGKQLYMMRPVDLLRRAAAIEVEVRSESVSDVARVSESQEGATWTPAGVAELLRQLDFEERPHADLIREAARLDGFIPNNAIYGSGTVDDEAAHRLTGPVERITRMLQGRGVVARGVRPVLTPVSNGRELIGFDIPDEFVAALAEVPADLDGVPD
ncbi:PIN-like domain-containing protein [Saccharothrix luteola]|uniref:PIN-like domain-containing protein n=1 Tax=Saccharothrix luteola TaxID=2893018 RepID=UPI001E3CB5A0|nr:PIN-like domain-containing protein [Saccharothrix luteola]MCC8243613.1 PIN-like domain-containing protein [Saccharothrix luteola]